MRWIPVHIALPNVGFHVLTYEEGAVMPIKVNYIRNYEKEWAYGSENISYWCCLPLRPEDNEC